MTRDKLPAWGTDISSPHSWQIFTTFSNTNLSAKKYIKTSSQSSVDAIGDQSDHSDHSDHSEHSDHSDNSDHSDHSD